MYTHTYTHPWCCCCATLALSTVTAHNRPQICHIQRKGCFGQGMLQSTADRPCLGCYRAGCHAGCFFLSCGGSVGSPICHVGTGGVLWCSYALVVQLELVCLSGCTAAYLAQSLGHCRAHTRPWYEAQMLLLHTHLGLSVFLMGCLYLFCVLMPGMDAT